MTREMTERDDALLENDRVSILSTISRRDPSNGYNNGKVKERRGSTECPASR